MTIFFYFIDFFYFPNNERAISSPVWFNCISCKLFLLHQQFYDEMKGRIDSAAAKRCVPEHIRDQHKGFSEWNSKVEKQDHQSIVQVILILYSILQDDSLRRE